MRVCAVFDLDGTIIAGSSERIFARYLFEKGEISLIDLFKWCLATIKNLPFKGENAYKNNRIYLKGKDYQRIQDLAVDCFIARMIGRISKKAREQIEFHKERGEEVVFLSGTLDIIVENFKKHLEADLIIASSLEVKNGIITGKIDGVHPYGKVKAVLIQNLAEKLGFDLRKSYSYGNHHTDAEVLRIVGNPVAVNPNRKLALIANREKWKVEIFN
jgi:HAD superfamily hydrolase (TIGR01490 family)